MTEAEWLTTTDDPREMLEYVENVSQRKWRLFLCGCARNSWHTHSVEEGRAATETAERYADGLVTAEELTAARRRAHELVASKAEELSPSDRAIWDALPATYVEPSRAYDCALWNFTQFGQGANRSPAEYAKYCDLLRDIFGNPFRPVVFDPAWRTSDVMLLAQSIYEERAFDRMPILADALQDAGCDSDDILGHLRDPHAAHVRGCWALDLVLGKE
jgi:hypothetical protein